MLLQALCSISYPLVNSNWSYSPETPNLGQIRRVLEPCDLEIWRMTFKNNRAPLLCTGDPLHSRAACTQPCNVNTHSRAHCSPGARLCEQWGHGCVNNGARLCASARLCRGSPVLCYFKLCAAFHSHWWIQTGVTVRKRPIWVKFDDF